MNRPPTPRRSADERKAQIARLLKTRPRTTAEIVAATGLSRTVARRYLAGLRGREAHMTKPLKRVGRGGQEALWAYGPGPDVPPAPAPSADIGVRRQQAIEDAQALAIELRGRPRASPLQALVSATLHANQ